MNSIKIIMSIMLLSFFLISCNEDNLKNSTTTDEIVQPQSAEGNIIPDQYIISIDPEIIAPAISYIDESSIRSREDKASKMSGLNDQVEQEIRLFLDKAGVETDEILYVYTAMEVGAAIKVDEDKYNALQKQVGIISVEFDRVVTLPPFTVENIDMEGGARAQTTPCGITNAGGAVNANQSRWIWIVDTGIDLDHADLNVVTSSTYAKSFVGGSADDCHGHGTHCAGTAAATNNSFGVVGVAANAPVVPVRVLNCSGSGSTSGIIAGLNHVASYDIPGDVVNMSLGGYYGSNCGIYSSYKSVVQGLGNAGTRVAIAAGNSSANSAYYQPACINGTNVFTISSMTCGKSWSSFSNYNMNPVDYIATGSSVYSTYKNGGYATLSGTSMATPHVAGICHVRNSSPRGVGSVSYGGETYPIAKR